MKKASASLSPYMRTVGTYTAAQVLDLVTAAYERGRFDGDLNELAALGATHDEPRLTWEARVAARVAANVAYYERLNADLGRPAGYRYRGGPVDWETGMPARSGCAWFKRQQQSRTRLGLAA